MYPDYRVPSALKPQAPKPGVAVGLPVMIYDIARHWDLVIRDLADRYTVDLYDPAVLARPWPGIRTMIFGLLREPSRLSRALEKEGEA